MTLAAEPSNKHRRSDSTFLETPRIEYIRKAQLGGIVQRDITLEPRKAFGTQVPGMSVENESDTSMYERIINVFPMVLAHLASHTQVSDGAYGHGYGAAEAASLPTRDGAPLEKEWKSKYLL